VQSLEEEEEQEEEDERGYSISHNINHCTSEEKHDDVLKLQRCRIRQLYLKTEADIIRVFILL